MEGHYANSIVLTCLLLVGHVEALSVASAHADAYDAFMTRHGRDFAPGTAEYTRRLALFSQRAQEVERLNARPDRLWTAGITKHADWTDEELRALRGWAGMASRGHQREVGAIFLNQLGRGERMPEEHLNWTSLTSLKNVRNQGGCGSCWAVSSTSVLEAHVEIYGGAAKTFAPKELLECIPNPHHCGGSGGCGGATAELAFNYILQNGLTEATQYSKCGSSLLETQRSLRSSSAALEDLTVPGVHLKKRSSAMSSFGMRGWERLGENSYEPLLRAVVERGPAVVSVSAGEWSLYQGGVFNGCSRDATIDHAVVLVGFGKDEGSGHKFWLIQNSWGPDWGENGRIRLLRTDSEANFCGVDYQPEVGTACDGGPSQVQVCGMCGILYDTVVPHFQA